MPPPSALPPALTPLTSALHGRAVGRCGPPTRSPDSPGTSTTKGLQDSLPGPILLPPQGAPHLSPGAVPLQEPRSLERSSHCHSDAGRCRARRGHCRTLAGCHCHGECPSGRSESIRKMARAPKGKNSTCHPSPPNMVSLGYSPPLATGHLCSVHNSITPCFSNRDLCRVDAKP